MGSLFQGIQETKVELREEVNNVSGDIVNLLIENMEERLNIIKDLEEELECIVCLETAQAPLYCCQEQHLVCSDCRPRIRETGECPSCRVRYPGGELLRHRAAERTAVRLGTIREELSQLIIELDTVLSSTCYSMRGGSPRPLCEGLPVSCILSGGTLV